MYALQIFDLYGDSMYYFLGQIDQVMGCDILMFDHWYVYIDWRGTCITHV